MNLALIQFYVVQHDSDDIPYLEILVDLEYLEQLMLPVEPAAQNNVK